MLENSVHDDRRGSDVNVFTVMLDGRGEQYATFDVVIQIAMADNRLWALYNVNNYDNSITAERWQG